MTENISWRPSASIDALRQRAQLLEAIRSFFKRRGYLEVETPLMAHHGVTDVYLSNIKAVFRDKTYCLQTSPEYHMKRLLAAGSGPIFQLARVFRDDEWGRWHNPEFTLLEWYQLGVDHHALMDEMNVFLRQILDCEPLQKITYQHIFQEVCQVDPIFDDLTKLKDVLISYDLHHVLNKHETDRDQYLYLLMSHVVEPALAKRSMPVAVYDFPISQAALAKADQHTAARFEIYYRGLELANGFYELTSALSQADRFEADRVLRRAQNKEDMTPDPWLLAALDAGLPDCSGVALGVDRLFALLIDADCLAKTMAFDFVRA